MNEEPKKDSLNKVTHSVRAAQAVLQYGVGAMVDFPDQTLVTAAPECWRDKLKIYDDRFAKALGVEWFCMPTNIAYARFPEWYFCPKCRRFQPIKKWVEEYKMKAQEKILDSDEFMIKHIQCLDCHQDLVVARIVTVCEHGHLSDFPWVKWVHKKAKKPICNDPLLYIKTSPSSTEGLDGVIISCSCKASANLQGAFDKDRFKKLDEGSPTAEFSCEGRHPQKNKKEKCDAYPKAVQRGSSSVYFPVVYSSLVIPPYADRLNSKIVNSSAYHDCMVVIRDEEPEDRIDTIKKRLAKWAEKIALEIRANKTDVEHLLTTKLLKGEDEKIEITSIKYRTQEYLALSGDISNPPSQRGDFSCEKMNISEYNIPYIKAISLIDKVRVVHALIGFSRINPVASKKDPGFVHIKEAQTSWYPAYEVRGEGIFIEFDQNDIDKWIKRNEKIHERVELINKNYMKSFIGQNHTRTITPKFIMLHTLAHLLIKQFSFECGYSIASLAERIYCADEADGKQMAGIFIYTASGDSEGTLGGLVRQGRPDCFPRILYKAIESARQCSNDPVCSLSHGQGRNSLNLAACYACALLPETCCEERNGFLDRGLIIGTYKDPEIGFWSQLSE